MLNTNAKILCLLTLMRFTLHNDAQLFQSLIRGKRQMEPMRAKQ